MRSYFCSLFFSSYFAFPLSFPVEIVFVEPDQQTLPPQSSWTPPSRISSLKTAHSTPHLILAASTFCGSLHVLASDLISGGVIESKATISSVSVVDLRDGGTDCVTVGEDGKVNLVNIVGDSSKLSYRRIFDANGLVGYTTVKWVSPSEFVTDGFGFGLQCWDQKKPGGAVSQFKGNWFQGKTSRIIHSIDIHPSRKHTCLVRNFTESPDIIDSSTPRLFVSAVCKDIAKDALGPSTKPSRKSESI